MGGCVGAQHDSSGSLNENSDGTGVALGRNQPLKKEKPKWKSDYPMTDGQLRSKRDEFWDTAPAFEGRKEIWDALKAAAHAFESNDHELAQAIIDGANITLPHGALTECYDELGNRYQLPVYCLAPPINMIEEKSDIETLDIPEPPPSSGHESQLRLRLHGQRPQARGPQHRHRVPHEEALTRHGGCGARQPAVVLLRQASH